ncbi:glycosyl hydrolase catalytic core-domain-containing protein [Crepidotus variabilis]|uniref:Glycosyl hydrolase catalytic core-domain-containing protein n=1 Tax=Crepidotus variabilis TaxID=179855 RepID=A0A9P6E7U6_9AGAR|nr:glycosyl hydrolase catalytic core-domain-containing protein [Crepidotus variabilis]
MLSCLAPLFTVASLFSLVAAGSKNSKRGLCFAAGDTPGDIINANQSSSVVSWQYNWNSLPPAYLATSNIKYIPMQWGSSGIESFAEQVKAQGADTILAFNEPDFVNEANMQPDEAAKLWMQYLQPLKSQGIRLGGPAVSASSTGKPWLSAFLAACDKCTIDFIPLHWYGSGSESLYNYLWDIHTQYPKYPIWITEFAETSTNDTVVADFLNQTTTYLDTLDWIERYAWFGYFRSRPDIHYSRSSTRRRWSKYPRRNLHWRTDCPHPSSLGTT